MKFGRANLSSVEEIKFFFADETVWAVPGDSIASALLANGRGVFGKAASGGADRAPYCFMGVCFECRVSIGGGNLVRACMIPASPGMRVEPLEY